MNCYFIFLPTHTYNAKSINSANYVTVNKKLRNIVIVYICILQLMSVLLST